MMDNNNAADSANAQVKKELGRLFQDMQHDIPLFLFTDPLKNPQVTALILSGRRTIWFIMSNNQIFVSCLIVKYR